MTRSGRLLAGLVVANFLTSLGGGRLLTASRPLIGQLFAGNGSLLAFLAGSGLGLLVLAGVRRLRRGQGPETVTLLSLICSLTLAGAAAWLDSRLPWLFWLLLVIRCALWYSARSLRSALAASLHPAGLSLAESGYFAGFVAGLLLEQLTGGRCSGLGVALWLDLSLLSCVYWLDRTVSSQIGLPATDGAGRPGAGEPGPWGFWRLTGAFSLATIATQVVLFQFAASAAAPPELVLAAFYLGVAVGAAACSRWQARLGRGGAGLQVTMQVRQQALTFPLQAPLAAVVGLLSLGLAGLVWRSGPATGWLARAAALCSLGLGSAVFELVVLAIVGRIAAVDRALVPLALGVAATAATGSLFLLGLLSPNPVSLAAVNALGLGLAYRCLSGGGSRYFADYLSSHPHPINGK